MNTGFFHGGKAAGAWIQPPIFV